VATGAAARTGGGRTQKQQQAWLYGRPAEGAKRAASRMDTAEASMPHKPKKQQA